MDPHSRSRLARVTKVAELDLTVFRKVMFANVQCVDYTGPTIECHRVVKFESALTFFMLGTHTLCAVKKCFRRV